MDRLHLINVFVAIVDSGGFAGAARKLSMSPPAVTRAINELESHLGVRLLTRTTRVVRVTEPGARYVEDCRRILAELTEADESVSGMHSAPRGRLTLTAPALFGARFVTPIVTEYLQRYPEVSASCWFLDRVVNMMDEGVDVAVRIGELPDSSMQAIRVGRVRRVICAAPGYLDQHGHPRNPDELTGHSIVSASSVTPTPEWRLVENGTVRVVKVQPRLTTTTNDSAVSAASVSRGCCPTRWLTNYATGDSRPCSTSSSPPHCLCMSCIERGGMHRKRPGRFSTWRSSGYAPAPR